MQTVDRISPRGYKARGFIPCINNRCFVGDRKDDGSIVWHRSRMRIGFLDARGNVIDPPVYRCEREGCYYRDHPIEATRIRPTWGLAILEDDRKRTYSSDEALSIEELEGMA